MPDLQSLVNNTRHLLLALCFLLAGCGNDPEAPTKTILELIDQNPELTLTASYIREGTILTAALDRQTETWTFLAPTNDAWAALMDFYNIRLLNKVFVLNMMMHHSIPDVAYTSNELNQTLTSLWSRNINKDVFIQSANGLLTPGLDNVEANIISADNKATNGQLHVIDAVLMPNYLVNMKGTNAELICLNHEMEFFYKGIIGSEIHNFSSVNGTSYLAVLAGDQVHTLFTTSDEIFRKKGVDTSLYTDAEWREVIGDRIVMEKISTAILIDGAKFTTLSGNEITIFVNPQATNGIYLEWNGDYDPSNPDVTKLDAKLITKIPMENSNGNIYLLDEI